LAAAICGSGSTASHSRHAWHPSAGHRSTRHSRHSWHYRPSAALSSTTFTAAGHTWHSSSAAGGQLFHAPYGLRIPRETGGSTVSDPNPNSHSEYWMLQSTRPLHFAFEIVSIFFIANVVGAKIIKPIFVITFSEGLFGKIEQCYWFGQIRSG